jgi:hypothetical protein
MGVERADLPEHKVFELCPKFIEFAPNQHNEFDYGNVYAITESDNTLLNPRRKPPPPAVITTNCLPVFLP